MKLINRLERKFRKYAIPNLMYYIIAMYAAGFLLSFYRPSFYWEYLCLDVGKILRGQVWRIVTFMIYTPGSSPYFILFTLYFYYMIGSSLERVWGAFRFNLYFLMGVLGQVAAAFVLFLFRGEVFGLTTLFLNLSLFFAFAMTFPDAEFLLFFILPVKAKWLALVDAVIFSWFFVYGTAADRVSIFMALLNFFVFIFLTVDFRRFRFPGSKRKREFQTRSKIVPANKAIHRCAVCGRTEKESPGMEFRYCSICEGSYEYCSDHLYTHKHVTSEQSEAGDSTQ